MAENTDDRKYMELAISEMKKSRSEHTNKIDPLVGAVLVNAKGEVLDKTHIGGLREGDHAEYTLIERLLGNKDLEGSTLFVTLEPCTYRQPPKKPCAERIGNARISKVVVGIIDPNPEIEGHGISYLRKHNIEVKFFDDDLVKIINEENKDFIKYYQKNEQIKDKYHILEETSDLEKMIIEASTRDDFSEDMLRRYSAYSGLTANIHSPEMNELLYRKGYLSKESIPTLAGILLFGKDPSIFLPQSIIKMEAHKGDATDSKDVKGPLLLIEYLVKPFLTSYMKHRIIINGKQSEKP